MWFSGTWPKMIQEKTWSKKSRDTVPLKAYGNIKYMSYTDKKENKIFLIYKEIQMGAVGKSFMRKGFLIYEEMRKYYLYLRRPFIIYDFATASFWISLYMRKILFSFLSVYNRNFQIKVSDRKMSGLPGRAWTCPGRAYSCPACRATRSWSPGSASPLFGASVLSPLPPSPSSPLSALLPSRVLSQSCSGSLRTAKEHIAVCLVSDNTRAFINLQ